MGKIATEQEAFEIGGQGTPTFSKCCTKTRAEALGCRVNDTVQDNKLVQLSTLTPSTLVGNMVINTAVGWDNYEITGDWSGTYGKVNNALKWDNFIDEFIENSTKVINVAGWPNATIIIEGVAGGYPRYYGLSIEFIDMIFDQSSLSNPSYCEIKFSEDFRTMMIYSTQSVYQDLIKVSVNGIDIQIVFLI